ncbi:MAG: methionyl-tRNA formyltransferase [Lachnospiraceae bacterium]|nr:methionyl-tRNA formyltransferase [Lachnospiraceae bacterium]
MRTVFMGTPAIAAAALAALLGSRHSVEAVVTRPDAVSGRGKSVHFSPVKELALEHGIKVLQPEKGSGSLLFDELSAIKPDIIVVMAYGRILKKDVLELPKHGCINLHASLLPAYRGASPIQWAVLNGEPQTGITVMQMAEGLDSGDIIMTEKTPLDAKETAGSLTEKLAEMAGPLLLKALDAIEAGNATRTPQEEAKATYVTTIDKSFGALDFTKDAAMLERMVRGLYPWPSAYAYHNGKLIKFYDCDVSYVSLDGSFIPGRVNASKQGLFIETGSGSLKVNELQAEGKKRMMARDFLNGYKIASGDMLYDSLRNPEE